MKEFDQDFFDSRSQEKAYRGKRQGGIDMIYTSFELVVGNLLHEFKNQMRNCEVE